MTVNTGQPFHSRRGMLRKHKSALQLDAGNAIVINEEDLKKMQTRKTILLRIIKRVYRSRAHNE